MLSEYRRRCPGCGYLRALYYRESGSREVHIECPKCGLYQKHVLPKRDKDAEGPLFDLAERHLKDAYEAAFNAANSGRTNVPRNDCEPCRHFLPMIHQQLTYILRLMQHRYMMDGSLDQILADDLRDHDIVNDSWMAASECTEDSVRNLDNRYFGFESWLKAALRALGLSDNAIRERQMEWWSDFERKEAEHIKDGGEPYTYRKVNKR